MLLTLFQVLGVLEAAKLEDLVISPLKMYSVKPGMIAHTCNASTLGGWGRSHESSTPAGVI